MEAIFDLILTNKESPSKFQLYSEHFIEMLNSLKMYKHQKDAITQVKKMNDEDKARCITSATKIEPIVVVAPTGTGKSGIIFMLPYVLKSGKVLIITPSKIISEALAEMFGITFHNCFLQLVGLCPSDENKRKAYLDKVLEPVELITSSKQIAGLHNNLVITNAQKFTRLGIKYNDENIITGTEQFFGRFDTLIVDDAHHYPANTWMNIVQMFKNNGDKVNKKIIFLTATPYLKIGEKKQFVLGSEMRSRIAYWIKQKDLEGVNIRPLEFIEENHDGQPENVMRDILRVFKEHTKREPRVIPQAMILVGTKIEAQKLSKDLNDQFGCRNFALSLSNAANSNANSSSFKRFDEGKIQVAVTCGVGLEGYDNANIVLCVILRKITSNILFEQFVGRCTGIKRGLQGEPDNSVGVVLSYKEYNVKKLYENRNCIPDEKDPFDDDDESSDDK